MKEAVALCPPLLATLVATSAFQLKPIFATIVFKMMSLDILFATSMQLNS